MDFYFAGCLCHPKWRRAAGEASITPCYSLGGETEARIQPRASQRCLAGGGQHSLNPTVHRVQTCSKLGTISRAEGCAQSNRSPRVARQWLWGCSGLSSLSPRGLFVH